MNTNNKIVIIEANYKEVKIEMYKFQNIQTL